MSRHRNSRHARSNSRDQLNLQRLKERVTQSIRAWAPHQHERFGEWCRGLRSPISDSHRLFARTNTLVSTLLELFGLGRPQARISKPFPRFKSTSNNPKRRIRPTRRLLMAELLEPRIVLDGSEPYLVSNIESRSGSSTPLALAEVGGVLFFSANAGFGGRELWKSDGTEVGTVWVKDVQPGSDGSDPRDLTDVAGTLYFVADDGNTGFELWKSDGTGAGTVQVMDISPTGSSNPSKLTNVSGMLYFSANDGSSGYELWRSDGTEAGTVRVKDIRLGSNGSTPDFLTNVSGTLYFSANDGDSGTELWKSDGTEAGTVRVKDIRSGDTDSAPSFLTNMFGALYFAANDGTNGSELWKSDGTGNGTARVKDIRMGSFGSNPAQLNNVAGTLYFRARDAASGYELWKSDGSESGTTLVKNIFPGSGGSFPRGEQFCELVNVAGTVYFNANDGTSGYELWKSDGTVEGTVRVKDIAPGIDDSYLTQLTNVSGKLYFNIFNWTANEELWMSDGTEAGTIRVRDNRPGNNSGPYYSPNQLTNVNGTLYFRANDGISGYELWKSDGTEEGTLRVKDIWYFNGGSLPEHLTNVSGTVYFTAYNSFSGYELWKSDGTEVGTVRVKDIMPESSSSYPRKLTNVDGTLYFVACDTARGFELWRSDGTEAGTVVVKDIRPGSADSYPSDLTNVDGTLYFIAKDETSGRELWKSDGTEAGTVRIKDIRPGNASSFSTYFSNSLTNVSGTLYFKANDGASGYELWKSDGTEAATLMVKDILQGTSSSTPGYLTNVAGTLYFSANDGTYGRNLWKTDGTATGTILVKEIWVGPIQYLPYLLTNVSETLYFFARGWANSFELWKSDGTELGTVRVKDNLPYRYLGFAFNAINSSGMLYFPTANGEYGFDLWKSDGSEAGTVLVKDFPYSGFPGETQFVDVSGTVYFAAQDGISGFELWKSDGSQAGTVLVKDIWPGDWSPSAYPRQLTNIEGSLFFSAEDALHGRELWAVPAASSTQIVASSVYYKGSSFASGGVSNALDPEKTLAKEGAVPMALSYANLINSSRGINGLVFDITNLPANQLTAADFEFQVSPVGAFDEQTNPVQDWQSAPSPSSISVEPGSPSRLVIEWPDNAIANRWLRITIKANANTGLAADEVYYVGHLLGETTGPAGGEFSVAFTDVAPIRNAVGQTVDVSSIADIDKNGTVTFTDIGIMRPSIASQLTNITIPAAGSLIPGVNLSLSGRDAKDETSVAMPRENDSSRSNQAAPFVENMLPRSAATLLDRSVTEQGGLTMAQLSSNRLEARTLESSGVAQKRSTAAASSRRDPGLVHTHRDRVFESWDDTEIEENRQIYDFVEVFFLQYRSKMA